MHHHHWAVLVSLGISMFVAIGAGMWVVFSGHRKDPNA
jgi:hypothetical protein